MLMDVEPNTEKFNELNVLTKLVENYEEKYYKINNHIKNGLKDVEKENTHPINKLWNEL